MRADGVLESRWTLVCSEAEPIGVAVPGGFLSDRLQIQHRDGGTAAEICVQGPVCHLTLTVAGQVHALDSRQGAVLQLVAVSGGYRVEPIRPGGTVCVNGEELFCKDLRDGDVIELGDHLLRWDAAEPVRSPSPAVGRIRAKGGQRNAEERSAQPRRPRRSGSPGAWVVPLVVVVGCALGAMLLFQMLYDTQWPRRPSHYVDLARSQARSARYDEALATLELVPADADGPTRQSVADLRMEIRQSLAAVAFVKVLRLAEAGLDRLHAFRARYLERGEHGRPAARRFVRLCDRWQAEHSERIGGDERGVIMVREVDGLRARWWEASELPSGDRPEDVLFAADSLLRFQVREYKEAVRMLDDYLRTAGGEEGDRVREHRAAMVAAGREWVLSRVDYLEQVIERGDSLRAREHLLTLDRRSLLPEWEPLVAAVRAQLQ